MTMKEEWTPMCFADHCRLDATFARFRLRLVDRLATEREKQNLRRDWKIEVALLGESPTRVEIKMTRPGLRFEILTKCGPDDSPEAIRLVAEGLVRIMKKHQPPAEGGGHGETA